MKKMIEGPVANRFVSFMEMFGWCMLLAIAVCYFWPKGY